MARPMTTTIPARRLLAVLLALLILLPALALAPPASAANCVVSTASNGGTGSLRAALDRTNNFAGQGCETISFAPDITGVVVDSYLTINRPVIIQGPGRDVLRIRYRLAASPSGSVFFIAGGPAILRDLTIADGKASGGAFGSGLSIAGPLGGPGIAVTLERVRVANNATTGGAGGGIYASNATL